MRGFLIFVCALFLSATYAYADEDFEQEGMFEEGHDVAEEYGQPLKSGLEEPSKEVEDRSLAEELDHGTIENSGESDFNKTVPEPVVKQSKLYGETVHKESELRDKTKARKLARALAKKPKSKAKKSKVIAKNKKRGKAGRHIASVPSHKKSKNRKLAKRSTDRQRTRRKL